MALPPLPHQGEGSDFLAGKERGGLFDEPGVGKTAQAIYALDKIAPGTANDDTLLYGVEVKFYNMEVALDEHLETPYKGLYVIGDGSGITHSLSHASASGVYVAREILETV